jgi:hypothetical protein
MAFVLLSIEDPFSQSIMKNNKKDDQFILWYPEVKVAIRIILSDSLTSFLLLI